uniref:Genome polyprotein n=1 Tax=Leveillula taurica associated picorna-like virus 1 TaxID=2754858 RepID=A0A7D6ESA1_9PICO|nr:putative capsid protein [Leveillula taurica associated picorna-like virus 1]
MPTSIEKEMSDGVWMARNQLMKPIQISQVDWSVTQSRNTNIVELRYPDLLGLQESLVYRTLRMYAFYRISPVFRVQINATVFHQGQLIVSFDPFELCTSSPEFYSFTHIYATGLPNVKIMASYSDAVELKIPFTHPRSFFSTNSTEPYNTLGTFRITVLNPLIAAEGASSTLSVTTWVYGIDAQVHVPIQDHDLELNYEEDEFEPTAKVSNKESSSQSLFSSVLNQGKTALGNVTDIVGNVISGNIGQALRSGQGLIDTLGNVFGFDYPSRTVQPPKTISPIENLSLAKGVSQSQRLALDPFSLHKLHDDIALESMDGMNLKRLMQMPMLLTQFTFSSTSTRGTLLKSIIVNPCISPVIGGSLQRSYLSYISNGFVYWSGGIVYDIEIVATKFHSGKLIFAYEPNVVTPPSYLSVSDSLPNVIVDIQQSSTARFIVPYTSTTSMKDTFMPMDGDIVDSATGILCCYVQNTLAFASNVAPSIEINVYVSASNDFSLYVPQRPVFNRGEEVEQFEATSIQLVTNKNEQPESSTVLSFNQNFSISRQQFGEDYSLLDLVKRFSPGSTLSITLNVENGQTSIPVNPTFMDITQGISSSYLNYWSKLYCCWSGSLRYKFISLTGRNTTACLQVTHLPTRKNIRIPSSNIEESQDYYDDYGGFGMVRTQLSQDCALEIEVPYYSKFNMLLSPFSLISAFADSIQRVLVNGYLLVKCSGSNPEENIIINTYVAAGDDFRLIYPRPPPIDDSLSIFSLTTL